MTTHLIKMVCTGICAQSSSKRIFLTTTNSEFSVYEAIANCVAAWVVGVLGYPPFICICSVERFAHCCEHGINVSTNRPTTWLFNRVSRFMGQGSSLELEVGAISHNYSGWSLVIHISWVYATFLNMWWHGSSSRGQIGTHLTWALALALANCNRILGRGRAKNKMAYCKVTNSLLRVSEL